MPFSPPVDPSNSFLTSGFGVRTSGRTGLPTFHAGVDFRGSVGDPVFAAGDGIVTFASDDVRRRTRTYGYGACLAIKHVDIGQWTVYAHLDQVLVRPDQMVQAGQLIGRCGRSSNGKFAGMGPHLHFEVRNASASAGNPFPGPYRRNNVDPQPWLTSKGIRPVRRGFELGPGVVAPRPGVSGLGNVANASTLDLDYEGLPEEPVRDPWTYDPVSAPVLVGLALAGATSAGAGLWLAATARRGN